MEDNGVLEAKELMQVTLDLSVYRQTLAYALGNLAIMILISSGLLIVQSFIDSYPIIILLWIVLSVFAVFVHIYVFRNVLRRINLGIAIYSYPLVITGGYLINFLLKNPIPTDFLWYPLLGICNVIVGITAETKYYKMEFTVQVTDLNGFQIFNEEVFTSGLDKILQETGINEKRLNAIYLKEAEFSMESNGRYEDLSIMRFLE